METTTFRSTAKLESSWLERLAEDLAQPSMDSLRSFLKEQYAQGKIIYPERKNYFQAFAKTPFAKCKVVVLGQDPYHGAGQAHGLSFSVLKGVPKPPSLVNIFKELRSDIGCSIPESGDLSPWAEQGVLLLNSVLTVEQGQPGSHQGRGWELFTDAVVKMINEQKQNVVFVLWGAYAQKKAAHVHKKRHLVLESVHPSPLSSHRGFFGSQPFSKINSYLQATGQSPIRWELP